MLNARLRLVPWQHHYELSNSIIKYYKLSGKGIVMLNA